MGLPDGGFETRASVAQDQPSALPLQSEQHEIRFGQGDDWVYWRSWISTFADVIGLAAFVLTIATLITIKKMRASILSRARLPSHIKKLIQYASSLNNTLQDARANEAEIRSTLSQLDSTLLEVMHLVEGEAKSKASLLRRNAKTFANGDLAINKGGWEVHADVNGLLVALEIVVENERVVPRT